MKAHKLLSVNKRFFPEVKFLLLILSSIQQFFHELFAEKTGISYQEMAAFIYDEERCQYYFLANTKNYEKVQIFKG